MEFNKNFWKAPVVFVQKTISKIFGWFGSGSESARLFLQMHMSTSTLCWYSPDGTIVEIQSLTAS